MSNKIKVALCMVHLGTKQTTFDYVTAGLHYDIWIHATNPIKVQYLDVLA